MIKYLLAILAILSSASAQMFMKKASDLSMRDVFYYVFIGSAGLFYLASFGLYAVVLKYFPITKISPVMTLGTMTVVIILGIFMFHEIITIKQGIGLIFGAAAIILIAS